MRGDFYLDKDLSSMIFLDKGLAEAAIYTGILVLNLNEIDDYAIKKSGSKEKTFFGRNPSKSSRKNGNYFLIDVYSVHQQYYRYSRQIIKKYFEAWLAYFNLKNKDQKTLQGRKQ